MGKYNRTYVDRSSQERKWEIHPIWRGLGFLLIILVILMSAVGAREIANQNRIRHWVPLAGGIDNNINLEFKLDFLANPINLNGLISWIPGYPFRGTEVTVFIALLFLGFGMLGTVYAALWRAAGPPKDPFDAPEYDMRIKRRPK